MRRSEGSLTLPEPLALDLSSPSKAPKLTSLSQATGKELREQKAKWEPLPSKASNFKIRSTMDQEFAERIGAFLPPVETRMFSGLRVSAAHRTNILMEVRQSSPKLGRECPGPRRLLLNLRCPVSPGGELRAWAASGEARFALLYSA